MTKTEEQTPVATDATTASHEEKRKPVARLAIEDCSASVWAREHVSAGRSRTYYSVSFERSYKSRDGVWKYTRSFDPESLGKVVQLCQQASEAVAGMMQKDAAA